MKHMEIIQRKGNKKKIIIVNVYEKLKLCGY